MPLFFIFALIFFTLDHQAFAQHKSQICTASGCKCYETWTPYWDEAWQACRDRIEGQQTGVGDPLKGEAYMRMNRTCSEEAGRLTLAKKQNMGVLADSLQEFREVSCPEAAAQPGTRQPPTDSKGQPLPGGQEGVSPPPCIREVESAAAACQQAQTAATQACNDQNNAALNASNQQGVSTGNSLSGTSATAGSCTAAADHQRQFAAALDNFIQSCGSARQSCASSCSEAQAKLQRCQNPATRDAGQEVAGNATTCGESGPLAKKVNDATQDRRNSVAAQQDGEACASDANASAHQNRAPLGANRQKTDTSGGGLGESSSVNAGGQNENGAGTPVSGTGGSALTGNRQPGSLGGNGTEEKYNVSGAMDPKEQSASGGGAYVGSSLADLPGTPAAIEGASNAEKNEVTSALGSSTLAGGGGGRGLRLMKLMGLKGATSSLDEKDPEAKAAAGEDVPDLNQFRPVIAGMKPASNVLLGPHASLFDAVSKAYQRAKPSLFQEGE